MTMRRKKRKEGYLVIDLSMTLNEAVEHILDGADWNDTDVVETVCVLINAIANPEALKTIQRALDDAVDYEES